MAKKKRPKKPKVFAKTKSVSIALDGQSIPNLRGAKGFPEPSVKSDGPFSGRTSDYYDVDEVIKWLCAQIDIAHARHEQRLAKLRALKNEHGDK